MSYHDIITDATGETDPTKVEEIDDIMRHSIFHSTLDWQTKKELSDAAQLAVEVLSGLAGEKGVVQ